MLRSIALAEKCLCVTSVYNKKWYKQLANPKGSNVYRQRCKHVKPIGKNPFGMRTSQ